MAFDRRAAREQLKRRAKESYDRKDAFSDSVVGILRQDVKMVPSLAAGTHFFDIIPFKAGRYWPTKLGYGAPGEYAPYMEVFVHQNVGPSDAQYVCPAANYGKPCPICEQQGKLREKWPDPTEEQQKIIKSLYPRRRCIYNVIQCDDAQTEAKGIQVWDMAHWSVQRHIEALVVGRSGEPEIFYADPDEGKTLKLTRQGTGMTTQWVGHMFVDRDYVIPDEDLDNAYVLDECLVLPKDENGDVLWKEYYKIIKDAFMAGEDDEVDEDEEQVEPEPQPAPRTRRTPPMAAQTSSVSSSDETNEGEEDTHLSDNTDDEVEPEPQPAPRTRRTRNTSPDTSSEVPWDTSDLKETSDPQPAPRTRGRRAVEVPPAEEVQAPVRSRRRMA